MGDTDTYQDLKDTKSEYIDKEYGEVKDKLEIDIYQVQASSKTACFQLVGSFSNTPAILINQFNLQSNIACVLSSCFYSINELRDTIESNRYAMIKLLLNKKEGRILKPFSCLMLNFTSYDTIDQSNLSDKLTNNKESIAIKGYWTVTFHFQDKIAILSKLPIFTDVSLIIEVMIDLLRDPLVQEEIARIVK